MTIKELQADKSITLQGEKWKAINIPPFVSTPFFQEPTNSLDEIELKQIRKKYAVSNYGRVFNLLSKRLVSLQPQKSLSCSRNGKIYQRKNSRTYLIVSCYLNGKHFRWFVHRLVATAFIPNEDPEHQTVVDHIDNDPMNNMVSNLRWATPQSNLIEAHNNQTQIYTRWLISKLEDEKEKNSAVSNKRNSKRPF